MKEISDEDRSWLLERSPGLTIELRKCEWLVHGELKIDMLYDPGKENQYILFPHKSDQTTSNYIQDKFQIRIHYREEYFIPKVYETAKRMEMFASQRSIPLGDLHINPGGDLCLCPRSLERTILTDNFALKDFLERLVVPFFYAQSYFEQHNKWPWKDYSHGDPGILECFTDKINDVIDKGSFIEETLSALQPQHQNIFRSAEEITRQTLCICGSKNKFRICHHDAWQAAKLLKQHIR